MAQHDKNPYLNLIQQLLAAPSEQLNQILKENSQFLNINLIESLVTIAEQLSTAGDENGTRYFLSLAQYTAQILAEREQQKSLGSRNQPPSNLGQSCATILQKLNYAYLCTIDVPCVSSFNHRISSYKSA